MNRSPEIEVEYMYMNLENRIDAATTRRESCYGSIRDTNL
jgi:hypothetical protein